MPLTQSTRPQSTRRDRLKADRREELLRIAARLFAERGFRAVSLEELGAAAGVTGPAVYRHFASKQAVLADLLVGVSRRLLDGGRVVVGAAATDEDALRGLIGFHTDFALSDPDLIRVQDRDLNSLTAADARLVRRLQRAYLEIWVAVLARLDAGLDPSLARIKAHATFGLLNSTSHSRGGPDTETSRRLLGEMAMAGLLPPRPVVGA
jgi:AcrR family transcriptional regulator